VAARPLRAAQELAAAMIERFWEPEQRVFFDATATQQGLPVRPRNLFDNPIPSGTSSAAFAAA